MPVFPRVALISEGTGVLGQAMAAGLARRGVQVLLGYREVDDGRSAEAILRAAGHQVWPEPVDATDADSVAHLAIRIRQRYGRLDGLVHGVLPEGRGGGGSVRMAAVFDRAVTGLIRLTETLEPLLAASGQGRIVSLTVDPSSCAGRTDDAPWLAEAVAGVAVNHLTRHYAQILEAQRIKVNAVCVANGVTAAVHMALLDAEGPTGSLTDDYGELSWGSH